MSRERECSMVRDVRSFVNSIIACSHLGDWRSTVSQYKDALDGFVFVLKYLLISHLIGHHFESHHLRSIVIASS